MKAVPQVQSFKNTLPGARLLERVSEKRRNRSIRNNSQTAFKTKLTLALYVVAHTKQAPFTYTSFVQLSRKEIAKQLTCRATRSFSHHHLVTTANALHRQAPFAMVHSDWHDTRSLVRPLS